jgi:hypothetical protein
MLCVQYSKDRSHKKLQLSAILGGLVVNVLAIGPKVHEFKPSQGWWIFMGDKNLQYAFLQREVKPLAPCRKILRHAKEPFKA